MNDNRVDRMYDLLKAAQQAWEKRDLNPALQAVEEARALALQTPHSERAETLYDIAKVLGRMERTDDASNALEEALKFVDNSLDPPKLLLAICGQLTSIGRRERALEIALQIPNEARRAQALDLIG